MLFEFLRGQGKQELAAPCCLSQTLPTALFRRFLGCLFSERECVPSGLNFRVVLPIPPTLFAQAPPFVTTFFDLARYAFHRNGQHKPYAENGGANPPRQTER